MEEKRIDTVKNKLEPKLMQDIQIFLRFPNFYHCFIESFREIIVSLTLILKSSSINGSNKNLSLNMVDNAKMIIWDNNYSSD